ncbi:FKBP-type peptidyl-prolyl cis-trans isomerase [Dongshaea marina]|uniref:FKBP-type peptidyl-prolyl cis-trans isomerase n=1 Tax=Dongshaea marina TaxID=2047966 RepID=UPI000D3E878F|nr:FKBP-type peptidyl-prolyl cis-trans isomerase [Dongshaea marina]
MTDTLISDHSEVTFHFTIKLEDGSVADTSRTQDKPARLKMGDGSLTAGFEACLKGLSIGSNKSFTLAPEDAFGMSNPDQIHHMEAARFSPEIELEPGVIVGFEQPNGGQVAGMIREVQGDSVTVDFNHPLAGQTLNFDVEILDVSNPG